MPKVIISLVVFALATALAIPVLAAMETGEKYEAWLKADQSEAVCNENVQLTFGLKDFFGKEIKEGVTHKFHIFTEDGKEIIDPNDAKVFEKNGEYFLMDLKHTQRTLEVWAELNLKHVEKLIVGVNGQVPPIYISEVEAGSEIVIYNVAKQIVRQFTVVSSGETIWDFSNNAKTTLSSGVYTIVVRKNGKVIAKKKIAVVR